MMNRSTPVLVLLALALLSTAAVPAGAARLTIGLRYWYADWQAEDLTLRIREDWQVGDLTGQDYDARVESADSSSPGMVGPELALAFRHLELAAAFRYGQFDLRLEGVASQEQQGYVTTAAYSFETDVTRYDAEMMARMPLGPHFRVQAGYRLQRYQVGAQSFRMHRTLQGVDLGESEEQLGEFTRSLHGPAVGLAAYAPLGSALYLYGSANYLPYLTSSADAEADEDAVFLSVDEEEHGTGVTADLGLGWMPAGWKVIPSLSIRGERYDTGGSAETFWGVAAGIAVPL